jgi:hypothetical protein
MKNLENGPADARMVNRFNEDVLSECEKPLGTLPDDDDDDDDVETKTRKRKQPASLISAAAPAPAPRAAPALRAPLRQSTLRPSLADTEWQDVIAEMFVANGLALRLADSPHFQRIIHMASNGAKSVPCSKVLSEQVLPRLAKKIDDFISDSLKGVDAISVETECWTSDAGAQFLVVIVHWWNQLAFRPESLVVDFVHVDIGTSSSCFAEALQKSLDAVVPSVSAGSCKVICVISDQAKNYGSRSKAASGRGEGWNFLGCVDDLFTLLVGDTFLSKQDPSSNRPDELDDDEASTECGPNFVSEYGPYSFDLLKRCISFTKYFSTDSHEEEKLRIAMAIANAKARILEQEVRRFPMTKLPVVTRWGSVITMISSLCLLEDVFVEFPFVDNSAPRRVRARAAAAAATATNTSTTSTTTTTSIADSNDVCFSDSESESPCNNFAKYNKQVDECSHLPIAAVRVELQNVLLTQEADLDYLEPFHFERMRILVGVFEPIVKMTKAIQTHSASVHLPGMLFRKAVKELEAMKEKYKVEAEPCAYEGSSPAFGYAAASHLLACIRERGKTMFSRFERVVWGLGTLMVPTFRRFVDVTDPGTESEVTAKEIVRMISEIGLLEVLQERHNKSKSKITEKEGTPAAAKEHDGRNRALIEPALSYETILTNAFSSYLAEEYVSVLPPTLHNQMGQGSSKGWLEQGVLEKFWASRAKDNDPLADVFSLLGLFKASSSERKRPFSTSGFIDEELRAGRIPVNLRFLAIGRAFLNRPRGPADMEK